MQIVQSKKSSRSRGASLIRLLILVCIVIALLIFFNATSIKEITGLLKGLLNGLITVLKDVWYQLIMPIVDFFLSVLSRIIHK